MLINDDPSLHIYSLVNITLELTCFAITATLLICLLVTKEYKTKLSRILLLLLITNSCMLILDLIAWAFALSLEPYVRPLLLAANFMVYATGYVMPVLITYYLVTYILGRYPSITHQKKIVAGTVISACLMLLLLIISQFTGWIYYLDADNAYRLGPFSSLVLLYPIMFFFMNASILLRYRKRFTSRDNWVMLVFLVTPLLGHAAEMLVDEYIMFGYLATTIAFLALYVSIQVQQDIQASERELALKTSILRSRMNPHFMFNTLTAVIKMVDDEPMLAKSTLIDFSTYLRANYELLSSSRLVRFDKELNNVEAYLSVEKQRFGDDLQVEFDIQAKDFYLPPLSVQPMVENAVQHGLMDRDGGGKVVIRTRETQKAHVVSVIDDGIGFDPTTIPDDGRPHVGIESVRALLVSQCNGQLSVESRPGNGTTVTMVIPRRTLYDEYPGC